ncbi:MAG: CPXCG motif-containing cysteine-rich protein [Pseudomonadales bacterium]|nr:CPXCG motif-containing cysteine-rich protein [Pseudomonadales bacterium]NIX09398.1 CPXCG motif-containing cysteine-rich protein [Pseudomonadales bacterium]
MTDYEVRSASLYCPYCGEAIEILIDLSLSEQEYIEDCSVCCRPIVLTVSVSEHEPHVTARTEND